MKITDYLTKEMIAVDLKAEGRKNLLAAMVDHIIAQGGLDAGRREVLLAKLAERESMGSTGIGGGVAIPHASGENLDKILVAIGKFPEGVEYDAIDGKPVNLAFMIVGPEREPRAHLQLLAAIVRTLRNKELQKNILESDSPEEIFLSLARFEKN
ncbi:MAG: PTS sugar transporter subunit IIA [Nitrospinota bacterium]|nr:PTS sugar transporter subunit IIA [Nitrospinota bacterium]